MGRAGQRPASGGRCDDAGANAWQQLRFSERLPWPGPSGLSKACEVEQSTVKLASEKISA